MTIRKEISLQEFEFWSGAKTFAEKLTTEELDTIESFLEDMNAMLTETQLNDFFWFDSDYIAELLGETLESIMARP